MVTRVSGFLTSTLPRISDSSCMPPFCFLARTGACRLVDSLEDAYRLSFSVLLRVYLPVLLPARSCARMLYVSFSWGSLPPPCLVVMLIRLLSTLLLVSCMVSVFHPMVIVEPAWMHMIMAG